VGLRRIVGDFIRKRNPIDVEQMRIPIKKTPPGFKTLRIAHVSDTHLPRCDFSPREIAVAVEKQHPDVIFLTGDVMDGRSAFDGASIAVLIDLLIKIAPVYAVSGNHERKNPEYYPIWRTMLKLRGVHFMNDKVTRIKKDGMTFVIVGLRDISYALKEAPDLDFLNELKVAEDECYLLLHHRPKLWRTYYPKGAPIPEVVFSGHAHGGQIRLPLIKRGVIAPNQGLFPKYISGIYRYKDGSKEVISRGLASSTRPIRINNKPHIPLVELVAETSR